MSSQAATSADFRMRPDAIASLARINLDDLVSSFGWQDRPLLAALSRRAFAGPGRSFARQMAEFDSAVGSDGLVAAARLALSHYVRGIRIFGRERLPAGSFLALSNHPGITDALALFAALDRPDLKIVASRRPFLGALPHTSARLFWTSEDRPSRTALVREVGAHLCGGGAALTFPAGRIEPDPALHADAAHALRSWSDSARLFVRLAPDTAIVPVLVRGVVWPKAEHRWLAGPSGAAKQGEKRAAAVQLLAHVVLKIRPVTVCVQIGTPIYARELGSGGTRAIHEAVVGEMARLIADSPQGDGERVV